jgi:hypothetical protein
VLEVSSARKRQKKKREAASSAAAQLTIPAVSTQHGDRSVSRTRTRSDGDGILARGSVADSVLAVCSLFPCSSLPGSEPLHGAAEVVVQETVWKLAAEEELRLEIEAKTADQKCTIQVS